jgi:hypothetical protein
MITRKSVLLLIAKLTKVQRYYSNRWNSGDFGIQRNQGNQGNLRYVNNLDTNA